MVLLTTSAAAGAQTTASCATRCRTARLYWWWAKSELGDCCRDRRLLSARSGLGLAELSSALLELCGLSGEGQGLLLALNQRQCDLAATASAALGRSQQAARDGLPWDFWTIDLREAIRALGEITGAEITEAVLDRVFSRFCIGK